MKRLDTYDQHFLRSPRLVAELVGHSNIRKNDTVYDLGAGSGVITSVLARRCRQVVAVEVEPKTIETLRQNTQNMENVTVVQKDILKLPIPDGPYKIFANPPFSISSNIIERFLFSANPPKATYLVVQRQFARKLMLEANHFTNQLGMMIGPSFTTRIRRPLKKTDFWPHPAVDTVLLEIKRREEPLLPANQLNHYYAYINHYFTNPQEFYLRIGKQIKPSSLKLSEWLQMFTADQGTSGDR